MRLRLGTRASPLALAQAHGVAAKLKASGSEVELVPIVTSGDRSVGSAPPAPQVPGPPGPAQVPRAVRAAGEADFTKALFVKEIEEALLRSEVDLAVHSAKDLPARLPEGLAVAAYPEREDAGDVLVAGSPLAALATGSRIATSSLRRRIQLRLLRADLQAVAIRGNVDTRLRRLQAGEVEGLVLAAAGLNRLGRAVQRERLDIVSAPGQGALAVEARADRPEVSRALAVLEDPRTRTEVEAERELMRALGGGCRTPLGARAELDGSWVRLAVFWSDPEGARPVRLSARSKADPSKVAETVRELAERVRDLAR